MKTKLNVIKDYDKLPDELKEQVKLAYPTGFSQHLIEFVDAKGAFVSALPFESENFKYLIRMTSTTARKIIKLDDDYDDYGMLKDEVKDNFEEKYSDTDSLED